jgi:hypothetical protein
VKRTPEWRSAFPRDMTLEDCRWSLDERICQEMCDPDYDVYDELKRLGYWVALLVEDDMLKLASSSTEAGKHERDHGAECVVIVKLIDNDKEIAR